MATDPLQSAIDLTSGAIDQVGAPDNASWLFSRCWFTAMRFEHHQGEDRDADRAFADFRALPADFPGRAKLGAVVVTATLRRGALRDPARIRLAREITAIADADPNPLPARPKASAVVRSLALANAAQQGEPGFRLREAVREADELVAIVGDEEPYATMADTARHSLRQLAAVDEADIEAAEAAGRGLKDVLGRAGNERVAGQSKFLVALADMQAAMLRYDVAGMTAIWSRLRAAALDRPVGDPLRARFESLNQAVGPLMRMVETGDLNDPGGRAMMSDPQLVQDILDVGALAQQPGMSPAERAMRLATGATTKLMLNTPKAIDEAIADLTEAVELAGPHDPRRSFYLMNLGSALIDRRVRGGGRDDLTRGIELLEQARDAAGSVTHTYWSTVAVPLSHAYRMSGRLDLAREVALSGLRGHVWSALLQSEPAHVHAAARSSAQDALDVARMCVVDNSPEQAVAALESCRGLILFSALETRDLERRLVDAGAPALAKHWRQSAAVNPAELPDDLRRRTMSALTGIALLPDGSPGTTRGAGPTRLLDAPGLPEIRAALDAVGADALVYLVPGDEHSGAAVVVPADDQASRFFLPELKASRLAEFDDFLVAAARGATRDADVRRHRTATLDDVCDWAWDVAIGPLLEHLPKPADRPIRLVLVPMRELVRVPWHAARNRLNDERAVEHAVFSYAASARLMCETAWRKRVPLSGAGLVVSDPDTDGAAWDLTAARTEAVAITGLYPRARVVGRTPEGTPAPDGPGDKADLVDWLGEASGGALLHLACHGVVRAGVGADATSYLLLAGGERFTAEELTETLAKARGQDIALAVLAACNSAESGRGYDEAFSIGSAFLAAGVRTVVSAQWSVPDSPTSVLMFMFHHFLREEGLPPVDALRAAQLWAVRDRRPPESMPAELRRYAETHPVDAIASWAGFVHSGQ